MHLVLTRVQGHSNSHFSKRLYLEAMSGKGQSQNPMELSLDTECFPFSKDLIIKIIFHKDLLLKGLLGLLGTKGTNPSVYVVLPEEDNPPLALMEEGVQAYNLSSDPPLMVTQKLPVLIACLASISRAAEMKVAQARMPHIPTVHMYSEIRSC